MSMGNIYEWRPTINTVPYTDKDVLGTGNAYAVTGVPLYNGAVVILQSVCVRDHSNSKIGIDFLFFSEAPSGTYTNNALFNIADADRLKYIGKFSIVAADYASWDAVTGDFAEANRDAIGKAFSKLPAPISGDAVVSGVTETVGTLYMIAVVRGAPTYAAADISARFTFVTGERG